LADQQRKTPLFSRNNPNVKESLVFLQWEGAISLDRKHRLKRGAKLATGVIRTPKLYAVIRKQVSCPSA